MKREHFTVSILLVLVSLAGFVAGHLARGDDARTASFVGMLAIGVVVVATAVAGLVPSNTRRS